MSSLEIEPVISINANAVWMGKVEGVGKAIDSIGREIIEQFNAIWNVFLQFIDYITVVFATDRSLTLANRAITHLFAVGHINEKEYIGLVESIVEPSDFKLDLISLANRVNEIANLKNATKNKLLYYAKTQAYHSFIHLLTSLKIIDPEIKESIESLEQFFNFEKELPQLFDKLLRLFMPARSSGQEAYIKDLCESKEWKKLLMMTEYLSLKEYLFDNKERFSDILGKFRFASTSSIENLEQQELKERLNDYRDAYFRVLLTKYINVLDITPSDSGANTVKRLTDLLASKERLDPNVLRSDLIYLIEDVCIREKDALSKKVYENLIIAMKSKAFIRLSDLYDLLNPHSELDELYKRMQSFKKDVNPQDSQIKRNQLYSDMGSLLYKVDQKSNQLVTSLKIGLVRRRWRKIHESFDLGLKHTHCDCDLSANHRFHSLHLKKKIVDPSFVEAQAAKVEGKKIVLIPIVMGGGGHVAASKAIKSYLDPNSYHVISIDVPTDVLLANDPVNKLARLIGANDYNYTDLYGWLMHKGLTGILNPAMHPFFPRKSQLLESVKDQLDGTVIDSVRNLFAKVQPDIILPVYHNHVKLMTLIAQEMDLPIIHVQTDFIYFIDWLKDPSYENFRHAFPLLGHPQKMFSEEQVNQNLVVHTGYASRKPFLKKASDEQLRLWRYEIGMKTGDRSVMILNGSECVRSEHVESIALHSSGLNQHVHVFIACGRNEPLINEYKLLNQNPNKNPLVIIHPLPYLTGAEVHKYLSVADLAIGKPGGGFSNEVLRTQTYFLVDNTISLHLLELSNLEIIEKMQAGQRLTSRDDFLSIFTKIINNPPKEFLSNPLYKNLLNVKTDQVFANLVEELIIKTEEKVQQHRNQDYHRFILNYV